MHEKIKAARIAIGGFLSERRKQMGRTQGELADFLGVSTNTINGIETGRFDAGIGQILKVCAALKLKPFFVPLEHTGKGSLPELGGKGKFLFAPDHKAKELYILHREFPACLIQVVQTTPVTFRVVDLYDEIEEEELVTHPFLEEAKTFWRDYGKENFDKN